MRHKSFLYPLVVSVCGLGHLSCSKPDVPKECSLFTLSYSKIISQPEIESLAHASNVIPDINGESFVVYYSGEHAEEERIDGTDINVKLVAFDSLKRITLREVVLDRGEQAGSFRQSTGTSPYDPCLYAIDGRIRVWMVVTPYGGDSRERGIGIRDYNISLRSFGPVSLCRLRYVVNGEEVVVPLTNQNLCSFADDIRGVKSGYYNIGDYPVFNTVKEYCGDLYTIMSFVSSISNRTLAPIILKSKDGGFTWEYCASLDASYDSECIWEVGWDISEQDVFYFMTRSHAQNIAHCFTYNVADVSFSLQPQIIDAVVDESRPNVFCYGRYIYWIQNVFPRIGGMARTRARVIKTDENLNIIDYVDLQIENGVSYFSLFENFGRLCLLYTGDSRGTSPGHKGDIAIVDITGIINGMK